MEKQTNPLPVADETAGNQDISKNLQDQPENNEMLVNEGVSHPDPESPITGESVKSTAESVNTDSATHTEAIAEIPEENPSGSEDLAVDEHEDLQPEVAFHELSRPELLSALKECIASDDPDAHKYRFAGIRDAYSRVKEEETAAKRLKFIENGGDPEDFEAQTDETDKKFDEAVKVFIEKRNEFRKKREKELQDNLKRKKEILSELKQLMEHTENISASFDRLHELQAQWRSIGLVPPGHIDELWKNYHHHVNNFYEVIKINKELRELDHKRNLELKTGLCVKAEELLIEPSIRKSLEEYKLLQNQWKEIGNAGRDQNEIIWERFKAAGDKLYDRRREFILGEEKKYKENSDAKKSVIEKAETLMTGIPFKTHQKWIEASEKMTAMLDDWKKIGFASRKENENLWKQFKLSRDRFYAAKEDFYRALRESQNHNYKLKVDICMEVESLKESSDWRKTGERIRQLQEQWKSIGPVAKKHNDKIWQRFKNACDLFYNSRKEHFAGMNDQQEENLKKKTELVERIMAFEQGADSKANLDALKAFQTEWIEIGHVPMKEKDKLHKSFRSAIDRQFARLKAESQEVRKELFREQVKGIKEQPGGKDKLHHQRIGLNEKIRKAQSEVHTLENNMGFLGASKAADALKRDLEKRISQSKEEIKRLQEQLAILKES